MTPPFPVPRLENRPLVLGHRGASRDATENTMAAFRLAMEQGADGVELDVWRCGSGEVVVFHDPDATRLAGSPLRICEAELSVLRGLELRGGERIPLLEEVLEALPDAVVNVELKASWLGDPRLAQAVANILRRQGAERRVVVSSFDPWLLAAFRLAAPKVAWGFLFEERPGWQLQLAVWRRLLRPPALHPPVNLATEARMRAWGARGLAVNAWCVDEPAEVERLCALGATALITNIPLRVREQVRQATGR